jgi:hypothetical protein
MTTPAVFRVGKLVVKVRLMRRRDNAPGDDWRQEETFTKNGLPAQPDVTVEHNEISGCPGLKADCLAANV